MGNTQPIPEPEELQEIRLLYSVVKTINDPRYGEGKIIERKEGSSERFVLKEIKVSDEIAFKKWERRLENHSIEDFTIVPILKSILVVEKHYCADYHKVVLMLPWHPDTLQTAMIKQKQLNMHFSEEEIWNLLMGALKGLSLFQSHNIPHQSIRANTLTMTTDLNNDTCLKICDSTLLTSLSSFQAVLQDITDNMKGYYLAPILVKAVFNSHYQPMHNPYKSDVFSLGCVMLSACLLEPLDQCFHYDHGEIEEELLFEKIQSLEQLYPQKITHIIKEMVKFNEDDRPDFQELKKKYVPKAVIDCTRGNLNDISKTYQTQEFKYQAQLDQYNSPGSMEIFPLSSYRSDNITPMIMQMSKQNQNQPNQGERVQVMVIQVSSQDIQIFGKSSDIKKSIVKRDEKNFFQSQTDNQRFNSQERTGYNLAFDNSSPQSIIQNSYLTDIQEQVFKQNNQSKFDQFKSDNSQLEKSQADIMIERYNKVYRQTLVPEEKFVTQTQQTPSNFHHQEDPKNKNNYGSFSNKGFQSGPIQSLVSPRRVDQAQSYEPSQISRKSLISMEPNQNLYTQTQIVVNQTYSKQQERDYNFTDMSKSVFESTNKLEYNRNEYKKETVPGGGYYEGNTINGKKSGIGTLYSPSGQIIYEGQWEDNKFNGHGSLYNLSVQTSSIDFQDLRTIGGSWVKFVGSFKDGYRDGYGTITMSNGDRFQGTFEKDAANGPGTYLKSDQVIAGIWQDNQLKKI